MLAVAEYPFIVCIIDPFLMNLILCEWQVTGQPSVLYYADTLFEQLGFSAIGGVLIGLFKVYYIVQFIISSFPFWWDSSERSQIL